jgi:hypothetical protein
MYSSKTKKQSQGPGNAEDAEVREPAEEYAPVIFAQDAYKHVISFDLLSGAVSIRSPLPSPRKIFFTEQAHGRKKSCNLWCSPCAHQSSSVATPFSPRILPFLFNPGLNYSL